LQVELRQCLEQVFQVQVVEALLLLPLEVFPLVQIIPLQSAAVAQQLLVTMHHLVQVLQGLVHLLAVETRQRTVKVLKVAHLETDIPEAQVEVRLSMATQ
jgi:hypothetical protein